jgi:uncharacterized repeat protein (TIGR01451 family)
MSALPFFSLNDRPRKPKTSKRKKGASLRVEALEDRSLPSGITISGFVFNDVNNNGLFESGESPIANNPIELHNASGAVVGTATTDNTGFYQFNQDNTINQTPLTVTKTVSFGPTQTDFNLQGLLDQFDPSLGTLQEIDITHAGSITSDIKVENTSTQSGSLINGTVSGTLTFQAPGGVNDKLSLSQYAGTFNAQSYDGQLDFTGASGSDFGQKTANGSNNIVLTGDQMTPYIGTGQVQVSESSQATSTATGGGNVVVNVVSTGQSTITVVYKYIPNNSIKPGNYTIVETQEPPGYFPGKNSSNGTVLNTPPGTEVIPVTITTGDAPNNDFGKLRGSSLSGFVYFDANDNGTKDGSDTGISGVTLTLSGTDETGAAVNMTATSGSDGSYKFDGLRHGTYTVTETPPSGYIDGAVSAGSAGGTAGTEQIGSVQLSPNVDATDYDFGHLKGGSLSGFVYLDVKQDGTMDTGDPGIPNSTLTLTGTDDLGKAVSEQTTTGNDGSYQFNNLRPGTYTITQDEPAGFIDGTDNVGTLGGTAGHDVISAILLGMGQAGANYNFGEKSPPGGDVGIVKTASAPVSNYGDTLVYTLAVTNYGPGEADTVHVVDTLPSDVTFVTSGGGGWGVWEQNGTLWAWRDSLAVGETSNIYITVQVPFKTESLTNDASVTTTTPDNNPNNNTTQVTTQVQAPPGNPIPQGTPPLVIQAQGLPYVSKNQLMGVDGLKYIDPNIVGNMALVQGVYQTLTGSGVDPQTNLALTQSLLNGTTTADQVVAGAWATDAHRIQQANQLYQTYLGRLPTASEQAAVVQALQAGASTQSQAVAILTSPAYQALHPTTQDLATALSQDILGQDPGAASSQSLVQAMGNQTLSDVVTGLFATPDAVNRSINQVYLDTLRRPATTTELTQWTAQLQAGTITLDTLAQKLLASQEFYQLAYHAIV